MSNGVRQVHHFELFHNTSPTDPVTNLMDQLHYKGMVDSDVSV